MRVTYGLSNEAEPQFLELLELLIAQPDVRRVCELGAGANPALPLEAVRRCRLDYTLVDASADELAKAPAGYRTVAADITTEAHLVEGDYDLVFSVWCAEHVQRGEQFHREVFRLLADGGRALHLFPTLYSPPFVLNRWIPEELSERILLWLQPHREAHGQHGKFPARYSWCRGPSRRQVQQFERLGYDVERYGAYFGHSGRVAYGDTGYLDRLRPLCWLHERLAELLVRCPCPLWTSYAYVLLSKPGCRADALPLIETRRADEPSLVAAP